MSVPFGHEAARASRVGAAAQSVVDEERVLNSETPTAAMDAPMPSAIGPYAVVRPLGEGGMGRVFACRDASLDREVAIKILRADVAKDPEMSQRFLREARSMAKVTSPHVVTVHQVGEDEHVGPYLVMELVDGSDVGKEIGERGMELFAAVSILRQAALGLKAAADAGLVHRDVKPENLFRTTAAIKVADFGLARPLDGSAKLTQEGMIVGTPHYMAPELGRGGEATGASDMYALGATFYELLAGNPPFAKGSAVEVLAAHLLEPIPNILERRPDLPAAMVQLIERMLAKEPADRVASYDELLAALDAAMAAANAPDIAKRADVERAPPAKTAVAAPVSLRAVAVAAAVLLVGLGFVVVVAIAILSKGETGASTPAKPVDGRTAALIAQLRSEDWDKRHEALEKLKKMGAATQALEEEVGLADLRDGKTCKSRRFGLLRLRRVGASEESIKAVREAQRDVVSNACMALEMWSVESKIRRRMQGKKKESGD